MSIRSPKMRARKVSSLCRKADKSMIFAADIGNSSISVGIYTPEGVLALSFKLSCDRAKSEDEYVVILKNIFDIYAFDHTLIHHVIIASVVPALTFVIVSAAQKLFEGTKPLVVGPGIKTSLDIKVDHPSELGADIVANAVAAIRRFPAPIAIIDLGTATTVTVINEKKTAHRCVYLSGRPIIAARHEQRCGRAAADCVD